LFYEKKGVIRKEQTTNIEVRTSEGLKGGQRFELTVYEISWERNTIAKKVVIEALSKIEYLTVDK